MRKESTRTGRSLRMTSGARGDTVYEYCAASSAPSISPYESQRAVRTVGDDPRDPFVVEEAFHEALVVDGPDPDRNVVARAEVERLLARVFLVERSEVGVGRLDVPRGDADADSWKLLFDDAGGVGALGGEHHLAGWTPGEGRSHQLDLVALLFEVELDSNAATCGVQHLLERRVRRCRLELVVCQHHHAVRAAPDVDLDEVRPGIDPARVAVVRADDHVAAFVATAEVRAQPGSEGAEHRSATIDADDDRLDRRSAERHRAGRDLLKQQGGARRRLVGSREHE